MSSVREGETHGNGDNVSQLSQGIIEGPLDESSVLEESQTGEDEAGLPDRFLLPSPEIVSQEESFFQQLELEVTETEGADLSRNPLQVDTATQELEVAQGGIVFSPGGSQAYVFPDPHTTESTNRRHYPHRRPTSPHGERPTTVGQSDEQPPKLKLPQIPQPQQRATPVVSNLQNRLEDLKSSLDNMAPELPLSSVESSPRFPRGGGRVNIGRDQFLNDPDSFNLSEQELVTTDAESLPSPHAGRDRSGGLTDRATSPSVASVISMASSTASGLTTGRKNLEWDSMADLGYLGEVQPQNQKDAAAGLSTLEKLAIGNYSSYLRTEPEGKPTGREKAAAAIAGATAGGGRATQSRQYRQNAEEEMRQHRLHKFADSLMRQRELRRMAADASSHSSPARGRRRSKSREKSGNKATPDSSPGHSGVSSRERKRSRKRSGHSPVKSISLTDLQNRDLANSQVGYIRNYRSNSDVSQYAWLASTSLRGFLYGSEDPSSCNSTGTVVPLAQLSPSGAAIDLHTISTDPSSLPPHLQGVLFQGGSATDPSTQTISTSSSSSQPPSSELHLLQHQHNLHSQPSQSSLHSRQSASRSFETVINVNALKKPQKNRWVTKDNLHSDSVDTEEEVEAIRKQQQEEEEQQYFAERRDEESDDHLFGAVGGAPPPSRRAEQKNKRRSAASSAPTTSDEESKHDRGRRMRSNRGSSSRERLPSTNTATSTLESAQIDRAKSFEYFPGEHFPIQENSSSYEYLPGHMVTDRPGTVVSNYQNEVGDEDELNMSGIASLSLSESTCSEAGRSAHKGRNGARRRIELNASEQQTAKDSKAVSDEQSRQMLEAHMKKTRHFYQKMKKYISYVATNSETVEDSRKKQEILDKLLVLMTKQESRMEEDSRRNSGGQQQQQQHNQQQQQQHRQMQQQQQAQQQRQQQHHRSRSSQQRQQDFTETEGDESEPATRQIGRASAETASGGGAPRAGSTAQDMSTNTSAMLEKSTQSSVSPSTTIDSTAAASPEAKKKDHDPTPSKKRHSEGDILLHQKRIEQMRVLRKEIKKLERLEYAHLGQALQNAGGGLTFLAGPSDFTDDSSLVSTSTYMSENLVKAAIQQPASAPQKKGGDKMLPRKASATASLIGRMGVEGKSASGSDSKQKRATAAAKTLTAGNKGTFTRNTVTKSKMIEGKTQQLAESGRGLTGRPRSRADKSCKRTAAKGNKNTDFGQTYPTPRDEVAAAAGGATDTKGIQTDPGQSSAEDPTPSTSAAAAAKSASTTQRTTTTTMSSLVLSAAPAPTPQPPPLEPRAIYAPRRLVVKKKKKPLAYYLPVSNESPIRIGTRVLRERQQEEGIGKENRSILANYMAGLDASAIDIERRKKMKERERDSSSISNVSESSSRSIAGLTLQDALSAKRPDFLVNANRRVYLMHRARQQRLDHEERVRQWMAEIAEMPAPQRKLAQPGFSPLRVQRIFSYKEMIQSTRKKYKNLPEVRNKVTERKKKCSHDTNRVMRDMYRMRLQENVLRGKVSRNHRNVV